MFVVDTGALVFFLLLFALILVDGQRTSRKCSYAPALGCTCRARFGRITISCVNLDLTSISDLDAIPRHYPVELDLSDNDITSMESGAFNRTNLKSLIMRNNLLASVTEKALKHQRTTLEFLDLRKNNLTEIPAEVIKIISLKSLILADNSITVIPSRFSKLKRLESLDLTGNDIVEIEDHAFRSHSLTSLSLTLDNQFIPNNRKKDLLPCADLSNLTALTFKESSVEDRFLLYKILSEECLGQVQVFTCDYCFLDDNFGGFVTEQNGPNLIKISLPNNYFTSAIFRKLAMTYLVSDGQTFLPNLSELDLRNNEITKLEMRNPSVYYPSLVILNLSGNLITAITSIFLEFPSISVLYLQNNRISSIDFELLREIIVSDFKVKLAGNPLHCTCDAQWLIEMVHRQEAGHPGILYQDEVHTLTCASPASLADLELVTLRVERECCRIKNELIEELNESSNSDGLSLDTAVKVAGEMRKSCVYSS